MTAVGRRLAGLVAATCLLWAVGAGAASASGPAPATRSGPDFCATDTGVTVVVDLTVFDGGIVVRCVDGPLPAGYTGWDALTDAGFSPQSVARTPGFACRLAGEPAKSRSLDLPEDPDYREQCVNTPPASAFWGYWYADNGGSWKYSSAGAASHRVIEGGFEGWAFALNPEGHPPTPGVAPRHPVAPTTSPTSSDKPPSDKPGHGGDGGGKGGDGDGQASTPSPTATEEAPSSDAPTGGRGGGGDGRGRGGGDGDGAGQDKPTSAPTPTAAGPTSTASELTSDLPAAQDADSGGGGGSALPTVIGILVLALLGVGAGWTAWKRRSG